MAKNRFLSLFYFLVLGLLFCRLSVAIVPINNSGSPIYSTRNTTFITIRDEVYGFRNLSYWVTDDRLAVIDGDVVYGPVDELLSHMLTVQIPSLQRAHSVFPGARTWPDAIIIYNYESDATDAKLNFIVNSAIAKWKAICPFLRFRQVANNAVGQNGVLTIKNSDCGGCKSNVGFSNTPLTMNLQQACPTNPGSCGGPEATHEFGHVLGLFHEHQRFDRESMVHYNCLNLDPACPPNTLLPAGKTCCDSDFSSDCCQNVGNFAILSDPDVDASGPYDIHSIMHYIASAFAIPGTDTLTAVAPGIVIPVTNPSVISSLDANRVCNMYLPQCQKEISCRAVSCPTDCVVIPVCHSILCTDPTLRSPPCCEPVTAAFCAKERDRCNALDCDF